MKEECHRCPIKYKCEGTDDICTRQDEIDEYNKDCAEFYAQKAASGDNFTGD